MHPDMESAITLLKTQFVKLKTEKDDILHTIMEPRDEVLARFQPVFSPQNVGNITEQEFKEFLRFENNKHWSGLHRMGPKICADMSALRRSLMILVDEEREIQQRLDEVVTSVHGMGKAIITAILLIAYPEKYGVWNNTSEGALKILNLWPKFARGDSFGTRYTTINTIFQEIAHHTGIDMWTIDMLWWTIQKPPDGKLDGELDAPAIEDAVTEADPQQRFGLERHLHEFLRDNWNHISLAKDWAIYTEPGDEEAGYEYPCSIGRIDLLAKHRTAPRWLVIELKRNQSSDTTIGQILRYIGWVGEHLADPNETVEGLVIAHQADESIRYALKPLNNVALQLYEVEFRLHPYQS